MTIHEQYAIYDFVAPLIISRSIGIIKKMKVILLTEKAMVFLVSLYFYGSMHEKHVNKLDLAHLNINSVRNKFEFLLEFVKGKVYILMISEKNIDESFPSGQFKTNGF